MGHGGHMYHHSLFRAEAISSERGLELPSVFFYVINWLITSVPLMIVLLQLIPQIECYQLLKTSLFITLKKIILYLGVFEYNKGNIFAVPIIKHHFLFCQKRPLAKPHKKKTTTKALSSISKSESNRMKDFERGSLDIMDEDAKKLRDMGYKQVCS